MQYFSIASFIMFIANDDQTKQTQKMTENMQRHGWLRGKMGPEVRDKVT